MKFLVLTAYVAVSSAASFAGLQSHPNGAVTPIDEPAVAAARADLLAAKFRAGLGYAGYAPGYASAGYGSGYASNGAGLGNAGYAARYTGYSGLRFTGYAPNYAAGSGYAGPLNLNKKLIAHPNGAVVPLDEPAVAAVGYGYAGPLNLNTKLVSYLNGAVVPVDEPAVAAARADHLASKEVAYAGAPVAAATPVAAVGYGYDGPLNLNTELVGYSNGALVPADEPAVAAARADHLASKEAVYAAAPVEAASYGYNGPLNLNTELVSYSNGAVVPADEPAVAAARADHLLTRGPSYAAGVPVANSVYTYTGPLNLNSGLVAHPTGAVVPVDEPAVAAARADHLATKGVYGGVASEGY